MSGPYPGPGAHTRTGRADAATVSEFRGILRDWIADIVDLDAERISDIVLATSEAMSNCAEHAYRDHAAAPTMTLTLTHHTNRAIAEVCITDNGSWQEPEPTGPLALRGRGLLLMRALADLCTITPTATGTAVCLEFGQCPARAAEA